MGVGRRAVCMSALRRIESLTALHGAFKMPTQHDAMTVYSRRHAAQPRSPHVYVKVVNKTLASVTSVVSGARYRNSHALRRYTALQHYL